MQNELTLRQIVDGISAFLAVMTPDGAVEIVNRQILDYFGKTLEELKEWTSTDAVHRLQILSDPSPSQPSRVRVGPGLLRNSPGRGVSSCCTFTCFRS
jgi:PAS domain-containing protein